MPLTRSSIFELMDLVGLTEIAKLFGVSRQRVHQLAVTEGFPMPAADLASGRVWDRKAIEKWAKATGRTTVERTIVENG
jgi:predicted DNA-binding transcriptional regulator AlpA